MCTFDSWICLKDKNSVNLSASHNSEEVGLGPGEGRAQWANQDLQCCGHQWLNQFCYRRLNLRGHIVGSIKSISSLSPLTSPRLTSLRTDTVGHWGSTSTIPPPWFKFNLVAFVFFDPEADFPGAKLDGAE